MHIYTVTMKDGADIYLVNVFAYSAEEAKQTAENQINFGHAIKATRASK